MISEVLFFSLLVEMIPKLTKKLSYFFQRFLFGVETTTYQWASHLDLRHFCGHTPRLVCPDTKTGLDVCCSDQMSLNGCDKTCCLQETNAIGTLRKNTWAGLDSTRSWHLHGPIERCKRYLRLFKCLFLCQGKPKSGSPLPKSLVLCRMDRVKTSGCFQNSEPSELGCV